MCFQSSWYPPLGGHGNSRGRHPPYPPCPTTVGALLGRRVESKGDRTNTSAENMFKGALGPRENLCGEHVENKIRSWETKCVQRENKPCERTAPRETCCDTNLRPREQRVNKIHGVWKQTQRCIYRAFLHVLPRWILCTRRGLFNTFST